jgi:hypothetical protein
MKTLLVLLSVINTSKVEKYMNHFNIFFALPFFGQITLSYQLSLKFVKFESGLSTKNESEAYKIKPLP